ncbi:MAG: hypothetical protein ABI927_08165, partial [Gaiellaceae bacterium]
GLSRIEQAVAFLALLELRKAGEIALSQAAPFAPIRVGRGTDRMTTEMTTDISDEEGIQQWRTVRSA